MKPSLWLATAVKLQECWRPRLYFYLQWKCSLILIFKVKPCYPVPFSFNHLLFYFFTTTDVQKTPSFSKTTLRGPKIEKKDVQIALE